jgi:hypothetical protein
MRTILFIFLLSCIGFADAQLQLNAEKTSFHFISIKNNSVGEVLTFDQLTGAVSEDGSAVLEIDLTSVNTQVETRDQRMKKSLFEVTKFPAATITTHIDMKQIKKLDVGEEISMELKGSVKLHGEQSNVFAQVLVSRNSLGEIRVTTTHPILVNARHFKLVQGIGILRKQAGLTVISSVVPVSFSLVFE